MHHAITPYWTRNDGSDIAQLNEVLRQAYQKEQDRRAVAAAKTEEPTAREGEEIQCNPKHS